MAVVLIGSYVAGLIFSLQTHRDLFNPPRPRSSTASRGPCAGRSIALAIAGVAVGVMSEILVGSISETAEQLGLSEFFIGVIVVAIVGNAAEHWVAVLVAVKDKMDLAVNIAIGSSAQIALFVAPVLVLASFVLGPHPMALVFNGFELGGILRASSSPTRYQRGRVDVVRGPAAAGRLLRARHRLLLRLRPAVRARHDHRCDRRLAAGRDRRRSVIGCCSSTCASSRAGASRASARASSGASAGWSLGAAGRRSRSWALERRRRRRQLHHRLPDRAHALARQPLRLPAASSRSSPCPTSTARTLLFWGIVLALVMRGVAILVGVELIEQLPLVIYVLGATLLVLAWRILRGAHEDVDPDRNRSARVVRRVLPGDGEPTTARTSSSREDGRRVRHADGPGARRGRRRRHRVRGRLDPRRVRDHRRRAR